MKWITALVLGAILAFVLPTMIDVGTGTWTDSWAGYGTIRPFAGKTGLLFSIPVFLGSAIFLRLVFSWHTR
ncbi:MAG TPA: hypothetical protein VJM15_04960 [Sphingomicrobium sp.]|nr:hypothetical protein [Sphingomicrobium sp.]